MSFPCTILWSEKAGVCHNANPISCYSVQAAVWQALNHYAYLDAVFLAERLYAEGNAAFSTCPCLGVFGYMFLCFFLLVRSEEALYLLATCYYRSGKPYKAYRLLKAHSCSTPQVRFLLAKCCVELSK